MKPIIVLTGPTAVGKTELSLELARRINGEIISCDSMQVYRHMDIGTAKIKPEQMQGIRHFMIDEFDPDEEFNVMIFKERVTSYIEDIYSRGKIPILVGGTGFYIQAVLKDIQFTKETDTNTRSTYEQLVNEHKGNELYEKLVKVDEQSAKSIHPNNYKRIIRALEYYDSTGEKFSEHNAKEAKRQSPYCFQYFVLYLERDILYDRIEKRIDAMIEEGLVKEVDNLLKAGYSRDLVSMQGLGYKEIIPYLDGNMSLKECVDILKRDTRHFAKRQFTWFRREECTKWINKNDFKSETNIVDYIIKQCKEEGLFK